MSSDQLASTPADTTHMDGTELGCLDNVNQDHEVTQERRAMWSAYAYEVGRGLLRPSVVETRHRQEDPLSSAWQQFMRDFESLERRARSREKECGECPPPPPPVTDPDSRHNKLAENRRAFAGELGVAQRIPSGMHAHPAATPRLAFVWNELNGRRDSVRCRKSDSSVVLVVSRPLPASKKQQKQRLDVVRAIRCRQALKATTRLRATHAIRDEIKFQVLGRTVS